MDFFAGAFFAFSFKLAPCNLKKKSKNLKKKRNESGFFLKFHLLKKTPTAISKKFGLNKKRILKNKARLKLKWITNLTFTIPFPFAILSYFIVRR